MSGPNSTLSAWQLAIMAVVIVASLAAWLIAVYLSDREPRRHDCAGAGSPGKATDAAAVGSITAAVASEHQPTRQARSPAHAGAAQQRLQAETPRH